MGNGPESSGDGWRYRGRGLIQLTGKYNYKKFGNSLGISLSDVPDFLETFDGAVISACWYWENKDLNYYADNDDIKSMTKLINGGYIGLEDRIRKYSKILEILEG
jgi:putative chitinase